MSEPITLILGGTGIKGVANIGVLQSLHNHDVKIKKIIASGTSSPISAQFALGKNPDSLIDQFAQFFEGNNRALWGLEQATGLLMSPRRRIVGGFSYFLRERLYCHANFESESVLTWASLESQITGIFGDKTFSDLKIPLAVSVINLKQGKIVLLEEGRLNDSIKASIAFPGILPPVSLGNMELVSSSIFCELPLNITTRADAPILTIDLPSPYSGSKSQSLLEVISQVDDIRCRAIKENLLAKTDYLFRLEGMEQFHWGNYNQIPEMVTHARNETDKLLKTVPLP